MKPRARPVQEALSEASVDLSVLDGSDPHKPVARRRSQRSRRWRFRALRRSVRCTWRSWPSSMRDLVRNLLRKRELHAQDQDASLLRPCEWRLRDLAHEVGMPWQTLRDWAANGWAHARQTKIQKAWIIWADNDEVQRLRTLRAATAALSPSHSRVVAGRSVVAVSNC
jgi:DNA-binding HxlR family transcriptional regulator